MKCRGGPFYNALSNAACFCLYMVSASCLNEWLIRASDTRKQSCRSVPSTGVRDPCAASLTSGSLLRPTAQKRTGRFPPKSDVPLSNLQHWQRKRLVDGFRLGRLVRRTVVTRADRGRCFHPRGAGDRHRPEDQGRADGRSDGTDLIDPRRAEDHSRRQWARDHLEGT